MNKYVMIEHARSDEQRKLMQEITNANVCPFCVENLEKIHKLPIVIRGTYWVVTTNKWPYDNAKTQILIISTRHVESIRDLTTDEWNEWGTIVAQATEYYQISSGAICMRFGDPTVSGASVTHLHGQIIVPQANSEVYFKIGK